MNNIRKILVVTPTLGNRPSLRRTIESVRKVGGYDVEHFIVCPQSSIEMIQELYGNIRCIAEPQNKKGVYPAINYAFQSIGGHYRYLTFINDDDYWLPEFRVLIDYILTNDIDMVYARTAFVDENNKKIGTQTGFPLFSYFIRLLRSNIIIMTQQTTIIKSDLFFSNGCFDESYKLAADTRFWAQISLQSSLKYKFFNREVAAYMIQEGQLSSDHETQAKEHLRILHELDNKKNNSFIAVLLFRLYNLRHYIQRIFHGKFYSAFGKPLSLNK